MSYSTPEEFLSEGLRGEGTEDMQGLDIQAHLDTAASRIDTYLRTGGYDLPIPATSDTKNLKYWEWVVAKVAILHDYGFDFLAKNTESIKSQYDEVMDELKMVAKGELRPIPINNTTGEIQDAVPETEPCGAGVSSEEARNWSALLV
jgi:phage gp36-like protein